MYQTGGFLKRLSQGILDRLHSEFFFVSITFGVSSPKTYTEHELKLPSSITFEIDRDINISVKYIIKHIGLQHLCFITSAED